MRESIRYRVEGLGVVGNGGYIGIVAPYSLLSTSKTGFRNKIKEISTTGIDPSKKVSRYVQGHGSQNRATHPEVFWFRV